MHTVHEAASGKYTVTDKAFVAQSVLFYCVSCGFQDSDTKLVFKKRKKNISLLLLLTAHVAA